MVRSPVFFQNSGMKSKIFLVFSEHRQNLNVNTLTLIWALWRESEQPRNWGEMRS